MYEVSRVNVKVERGATRTFTHDLSYVASVFTLVNVTCVCKKNLRESRNPP